MAEDKGTHSPEPSTRQDFPEVKDKIVDSVEFSAESDYYAITIRFQDKTVLNFSIEPCVFTFPVYSQFTDEGEENIVKKYEPIRSRVEGMDI